MNKQKWTTLIVMLALVGVAGVFLQHRRTHQKLGQPGIKATVIPGSSLMEVHLPEQVLNYSSAVFLPSADETNMLPKDTTIVHRRYMSSDAPTNFYGISINVVMMGTDRTSIHKPEYCLPGQGWKIEKREEIKIPMPGYELPAMKWTVSNVFKNEAGHTFPYRGFYVFWFTAENEVTDVHPFWRIVKEVLLTGVLPRWSYISYFCAFPPDQEAYAAEKMDQFVAASAPEFQLPPQKNTSAIVAR